MVIEIENQLIKLDYCYHIDEIKTSINKTDDNKCLLLTKFTLHYLNNKSIDINKNYITPDFFNETQNPYIELTTKIRDKIVDLWVNHKEDTIKIKI